MSAIYVWSTGLHFFQILDLFFWQYTAMRSLEYFKHCSYTSLLLIFVIFRLASSACYRWMRIEWPVISIHTNICEHRVRKELHWSVMIITRFTRVTHWMCSYVQRQLSLQTESTMPTGSIACCRSTYCTPVNSQELIFH